MEKPLKRVLAVVAGVASGVLLAGIMSAPLMLMLPSQLRGAELLWTVMALSVALAVWVFWSLSSPRRD